MDLVVKLFRNTLFIINFQRFDLVPNSIIFEKEHHFIVIQEE
jgi:hypothetical protein